ncbi:phospho-N-acetylmuramoyl-pentapeptide-transferase [Aureibacillus halotolerans]|uniref:phospho-N-acetylmuramoyl-pentapeptide- transferase n=1 Tax=Aureibacillus halotolerans TaxID=1508390 RepID=UPI00105C5EAD|nr:phospho-N-acetylmuramoyl-pentapeptide-transferase [Aureibacillus halotolerans]
MPEETLLMTLGLAFILTVLLSPVAIPMLKRLNFGQKIRDEGPKSHQKKSGTPQMGGLIIIMAALLGSVLIAQRFYTISNELLLLLAALLGFGLVGFLDDFIKVVLKRNLGLTSKQKMAAQILVSVGFCVGLWLLNHPTYIELPATGVSVNFGIVFFLIAIFILIGTSNAVNLTDGLDGLVAGTSAVAFSAFGVLAWYQGQPDVAIFCVAIVGAVLGFLVFNAHPAKIFMGDTGSLALGGALAGVALLTKLELLLVIIGGVFVIETLSVIIQVLSYKTTGKRVFKMSPLHHHYELSGWSEWRVVATFWAVAFVCAALGIYLEVWV